jgi:rhamnose transport system ATP-binding protein
MALSRPLIELHGITKQFGGAHALRAVQLALYPHEVHALVGENGAGKSTLVKILGGVHTPDAGEMLVEGEPVTLHAPNQAQRLGISVIHQHPTLFPDLDVAENVFMGHHPLGRLHGVDWKRMYAEVDTLLATLGVQFTARTPVRSLSVADQQLIEIAKALNARARVLVMDEPTASLSPREVHELFTIVRRLREQGVAILFVSHRLEEIFELADRITILRDGSFVISAPAKEMTPEATIRAMVGRELETLFPKQATTIGETVLSVKSLSRAGAFRDVSFEVHAGEILGLAGLVGAGRTEVAQVLFGIDRPDSGEIRLRGAAVQIDSPAKAMQLGIAYVPEDRLSQGLILEFPIRSNITSPIWQKISRWFGLLDFARERSLAQDFFQRLGIRAQGIDQQTRSLSGGNQQKVVLAKWLTTNPAVLILDEPTRGVDIGAKAEVHRIVSDLAAEGMAIILISSELPEVLAMADRILVLHEGRITAEIDHASATQEKVMIAATGQVTHGN